MIYDCTCVHETQDRMYRRGKRVHNAMGLYGKSGIRCTVCKKENKAVIAKDKKEAVSVKKGDKK